MCKCVCEGLCDCVSVGMCVRILNMQVCGSVLHIWVYVCGTCECVNECVCMFHAFLSVWMHEYSLAKSGQRCHSPWNSLPNQILLVDWAKWLSTHYDLPLSSISRLLSYAPESKISSIAKTLLETSCIYHFYFLLCLWVFSPFPLIIS